jgi:hypothetical protein
MPEIQKKPIQFTLQNIEIVEVNLPRPPQDTTILNEPFTLTINLEQRIDPEGKIIAVIITTIITASRNVDIKLGGMTAACFFNIVDFDSIATSTKGVYNATPELVLALNSISISTTRGLMFSEFKGTHLHKAILPIFDLSQLQPTTP